MRGSATWFALFCLLLFWGCGNKESITSEIINNPASASQPTNDKVPVVEFDSDVWDFGTITEGEVVEHEFKITNKGRGNLLIAAVRTSCGCTVADFPRQPIEPGQTRTIKVKFDSEGRRGRVYKQVHVVTNAMPSSYTLVVRGEVVGPSSQN